MRDASLSARQGQGTRRHRTQRPERGARPITERYIIVRTDGRYIGQMPASEYVNLTDAMRARTEVLAVCPSRAKARWIFKQLPTEWPRGYHSVPQDEDVG